MHKITHFNHVLILTLFFKAKRKQPLFSQVTPYNNSYFFGTNINLIDINSTFDECNILSVFYYLCSFS